MEQLMMSFKVKGVVALAVWVACTPKVRAQYTFEIDNLWDVGSGFASTTASYVDDDDDSGNAGSTLFPPIVLGTNITNPGVISTEITPTSSAWFVTLDAMGTTDLTAERAFGDIYTCSSSGDIGATEASAYIPLPYPSDGGNTIVEVEGRPYDTYETTSGDYTPVFVQLYADAITYGYGLSGTDVQATTFGIGTLFYNESITTYNHFIDPNNYFDTASWSAGTVPNGVDAVATFGYQNDCRTMATPATTVTFNSNATLGTLIFDNPNTYTINGSGTLTMEASSGDAQIFVSQGSHVINTSTYLATTTDFYISTGSLSINSPITAASGVALNEFGAGTLNVGSVAVDSFSINGTRLNIAFASPVSVIKSLSVAPGATLGIDSDMIIDYNGTSPLPAIESMVSAGYNGGTWDGTSATSGIIITPAGARVGTYVLGYAEASFLGVSSFDGVSVDSTAVLIKLTIPGDANLDGIVNSADLDQFIGYYGGPANWSEGDFNYDGVCNADDFSLFELYAGWSVDDFSPYVLIVPEPRMEFILAVPLLIKRKRRKNLAQHMRVH
jgi:hypothetical protein